MSTGQPDDLPHGIDEVGSAYRAAGFMDEPSPQVDAVVLAAARRQRGRRLQDYLPPLALAATVLLALGLVLRLTFPLHEAADPATGVAAPAAPTLEQQTDITRSLSREPDAPAAGAPVPVVEPATAASTAAPTASERTSSLSPAAESRMAPEGASPACSPLRAGDPEPWLTCIWGLLQAGSRGEARAELAAFVLDHPEYPIPNDLLEELGP